MLLMFRTILTDCASTWQRTQRTQLLHDLELKHQKNGYESDILLKDEDVRRLRVRILLLRDENTALRDQVDINTNTNAKLVSRCDSLNTQIEAKIAMARSQEEQLRKQEREFSNLKVSVGEVLDQVRKRQESELTNFDT